MRVFLATLLMLAAPSAYAAPAPSAAPTDPIEKPGTLARIAGGKTLHVKCMGTGSPTVILTPGLGGSTEDWRKVQPEVSRMTRVCAWDRLGAGVSSKATGRETVGETTADLIAALKAARIDGPFVVVGHSLGAYESLLLKDSAPDTVVGMVLVDPSIPDQVDRLARVAPKPPLPGKQALDPLAISAKQVADPRRNYGAMPVIVLTSTKMPELPPDTPNIEALRAEFAALNAEMHRGHAELAALSSRGARRLVPDSGHYIQSDQPDAIIGAIKEVLSTARDGAAK